MRIDNNSNDNNNDDNDNAIYIYIYVYIHVYRKFTNSQLYYLVTQTCSALRQSSDKPPCYGQLS